MGLPLDEKIVFSFGFSTDIMPILPTLEDVDKSYNLRYLIIVNPGGKVDALHEAEKRYNFVDLKIKAVSINELYTYLHASDVLLIHKESSRYKAVISSTVCQTLGSGCPILFHDSNYVELYGKEIVKYKGLEDMKLKLADLFDGKFDIEKTESYLGENNASRIADRFIQLFEKVREDRRSGSERIW